MPHKSYNPEEHYQLNDRPAVGDAPHPGSRQRKPLSGTKRDKPAPLPPTMAPLPRSIDSLMRTGLLMAALRVWELKQGIHDYS